MSAKITKRYLDYNGLQYLIEKIKKGIPFILKPTLTNQYDLGQTDKQWKNIYGKNVYQNQKQVVDTIKMNGSTTALTNTNGTVVIPTVAGPQGPRGEQGPVGPAAGFGTPTATTTVLAENANPTVSVTASGTNTSKVFAFKFGLPKGYQGATGPRGVQGATGSKGATGATGPRGVQGATGSKGATGATGPVGDKGQTGSKGATGATGQRGVQGATGQRGAQGATGPAGDKGQTGSKGATGATGPRGVQGATGPRGVQGATGGAGFIASVDIQNFTKAEWETYGAVGHQKNWPNTTIPAGMIPGDLFVVTGCATDTGDGYQLVYKYDPTFQPTNTTLRGTCISSHVIARHAQLGAANAGTNINITNNKINAEGYSYNAAKDAFAEGIKNYATGIYSHSEGDGVDSPGQASHAEGEVTHAEGQASHAEGSSTTAEGQASHAEGSSTTAAGNNSHAEGKGLDSIESTSFTCTVLTSEQKAAVKNSYGIDFTYCDTNDNLDDGYGSQGWIYSDEKFTNLIGKISVCKYIGGIADCPSGDYFNLVSGTLTNGTTYYWKRVCGAMGDNSHTEGSFNVANNHSTHAEGYGTSANGDYSHAEGENTIASNEASHAEGYCAIASGVYSHAEGENTFASKEASHAEGCETVSSGYYSHAEGYDTAASGDCSHAEGKYTTASGDHSHAEGYNTIAKNESEHAQGKFNKSTQAATGATGTASNAYSLFSVGIGTSDADRRNAIEIHKNGDIFINGIYGASSGNINYAHTLFFV